MICGVPSGQVDQGPVSLSRESRASPLPRSLQVCNGGTMRITVEASDPKKGMTAREIITCLSNVDPDFVPKVNVRFGGQVSAIKIDTKRKPRGGGGRARRDTE